MLSGKRILLGVTGGIAAYKAAELCRFFVKANAVVRVVMTDAAKEFITPLTMQTVSGNRVYDNLFAATDRYSVEHVGLAQEAGLFVIAPASANTIGKIAGGIADNLLTTTVMAAACPVLLAPAMNTRMYENPLLQKNLQTLKEQGYHLIGPEAGGLACGDQGNGRMVPPEDIFNEACRLLQVKQVMQGVHVLVTAGPTCESFDPVRFLSNHSSGKMGYAIAAAAREMGADVTLISGPTALAAPEGVKLVRVTTAQEMFEAVLARYNAADVVVKAAAVADYRPKESSKEKIKKRETLFVEFVRTPDILAELGRRKEGQILVGFAAETENLSDNATDKLTRKKLDLLVANDIKQAGAGFQCDTNIVRLFYADGRQKQLDMMSKKDVARQILQEIRMIQNNQKK